ncbi:MAG: S-adenosylmethionine:tRNA ribosyltransferase-isomerase [Acidimicrobiales bacterium]
MDAATLDPPTAPSDRLAFDLPADLEASEPAEARGMTRDAVRMLVAHRSDDEVVHTSFGELPRFLDAGDLVVINTSGTIPAAIDATVGDIALVVHLSTRLDDDRWVVEPRRAVGHSTERWAGPLPGRALELADGAQAHLDAPYLDSDRLWVATLSLPVPVLTWLVVHGRPIRYGYVERPWPITSYQSVYATEAGSAEMPSAGRPFTPEVVMRLVAKGVDVAPVVLHTGVASLEADEHPYPERVVVPATTAARVNATRAAGGRVIAIGTTAVRALETAVDDRGVAQPYRGWTDLLITPERGVCVVDGLLTGWHEPEASHLLMLEAVSDRPTLERAYAAALASGYRWHEFGDVNLLLP